MSHTKLRRELPNSFFDCNHMTVVLREQDHAVTELVVRPESTNPYGRVHGGAIYTLGDTSAGQAVHSDGRLYVTQYSSVHFLSNVTVGHTVRAESTVRHRGRSTCLCEVTFTDENGALLATGQYTYFCITPDGNQ